MEISIDQGEFKQLVKDVAMIKAFLIPSKKDSEGELSDWAKNELAEARAIPESECVSHEDVKKMILEK